MKWWCLVAAAVLPACKQTVPPANAQTEYRTVLDEIADSCGAPHSSWTLIGKDAVSLALPAGEPIEKSDCLIREFHNAKLPLKLGFIGNEAYETNEQ